MSVYEHNADLAEQAFAAMGAQQAKSLELRAAISLECIWQATHYAGMIEEWGKWFPNYPPVRQGAKLPVRPRE